MSGPDEPTDVAEPDDDEDVRRLLRGLPEVAPARGLLRRADPPASPPGPHGGRWSAWRPPAWPGAIVVAQATGITGDVEPPMA